MGSALADGGRQQALGLPRPRRGCSLEQLTACQPLREIRAITAGRMSPYALPCKEPRQQVMA